MRHHKSSGDSLIHQLIIIGTLSLIIIGFSICQGFMIQSKPSIWENHQPSPNINSDIDDNQRVYIAIIDTEFHSSPLQCLQKTQWIDRLMHEPIVENIEFISNQTWKNKDCDISPVYTGECTNHKIQQNAGSWIMFNALKMFINRSNASWLFIVDDTAFVRPDILLSYFKQISTDYEDPESIFVTGNCYEIYDYFFTFLTTSGILISRSLVQQILKYEITWELLVDTERNAYEAISQSLREYGLEIDEIGQNIFFGKPFNHTSDYSSLIRSDYSTLQICPKNFSRRRSCIYEPFHMNSVAVWNGWDKRMNKVDFLTKASQIFEMLPASIGVIWNDLLPDLCIFPNE